MVDGALTENHDLQLMLTLNSTKAYENPPARRGAKVTLCEVCLGRFRIGAYLDIHTMWASMIGALGAVSNFKYPNIDVHCNFKQSTILGNDAQAPLDLPSRILRRIFDRQSGQCCICRIGIICT